MKKSLLCTCLVTLILASPAWAHHRYFFGGTLAVATQEEPNTDKLNYGLAGVVLGSHINRAYSVEGRFGLGLAGDSGTARVKLPGQFTTEEVKFKAKLDYYLSALARFDVELMNDEVQLYGLLGLTQYEGTAEITSPGFNKQGDFSDADISWGFGVSYDFMKKGRVGLEWLNLIDEPTVNIRFYGLRVTVPFG